MKLFYGLLTNDVFENIYVNLWLYIYKLSKSHYRSFQLFSTPFFVWRLDVISIQPQKNAKTPKLLNVLTKSKSTPNFFTPHFSMKSWPLIFFYPYSFFLNWHHISTAPIHIRCNQIWPEQMIHSEVFVFLNSCLEQTHQNSNWFSRIAVEFFCSEISHTRESSSFITFMLHKRLT